MISQLRSSWLSNIFSLSVTLECTENSVEKMHYNQGVQ